MAYESSNISGRSVGGIQLCVNGARARKGQQDISSNLCNPELKMNTKLWFKAIATSGLLYGYTKKQDSKQQQLEVIR